MSIHLAVGSSDPVEVKALTDLEQKIDSYFDLGMEFAEYLDKPVASLPANLRTTSLSYTSGNQAWTPGEFTFTLCGGITGKITVISSGTLMEYMDEFPMDVTISGSRTGGSRTWVRATQIQKLATATAAAAVAAVATAT